ncbi:MAG: mannose-1-phosphate guanylyltransferase [Bacillota bacterium]
MVMVVIMAGGKGERFWPKSREEMPKQFINLTGEDSMILATYKRVRKWLPADRVHVVTGADYAAAVAGHIPELPRENIIIEPAGRNTAPCIGLAALHLENKDPEAVMVVLPADHLIKDEDEFIRCLKAAAGAAAAGDHLVTIGITPTRPDTGYGYIKVGAECPLGGQQDVYKVEAFVEKPDLARAEGYLAAGGYLWNSGMFAWRVKTIRGLIKGLMPDLHRGLEEIGRVRGTTEFERVLTEEYLKFDKISIDYGIMEQAPGVFVIPGSFGWDDVGTWNALDRVLNLDELGNLFQGSVVSIDTRGCIIEGKTKLIAAVGVEDLVVIDTDDVMFICKKEKAQDIKKLLEKMRAEGFQKYL